MLRYEAVLLRQRFDENRDIKDMRMAKSLLLQGEEELFSKQHYQPKKCMYNKMMVALVSLCCDNPFDMKILGNCG